MILDAPSLLALAQSAGAGGDPATAAAIALAESGGDPAALGRNSDQSRDRGLWQINDKAHPEVSDQCAFDPNCNAQAAYAISNGWTDFNPWTTYRNGAYLQFVQAVSTATQQQPPSRSLYGQQVVGQLMSSPWFPGQVEITQGWGPTSYDGEPEGHGYAHWHAGVDVGLDCGTILTFPAALKGTTRSLDNPGGYGTALVLLLEWGPAILLGHLRQRLVDDGTQLTGGEEIAITNSTGNSTGCHLHFEVRPQDPKQATGMARYGNDVDPSSWLLTASGSPSAVLLAQQGQSKSLGDVIQSGLIGLVAGGEVLLGAAVVLAGVIATAYGLRGQSAGQLQRDTVATARRITRPRPQPPSRRAPHSQSEAAESRIRPDLQRREPPPGVTDLGGARVTRRRIMTAQEARVAAVRGRR